MKKCLTILIQGKINIIFIFDKNIKAQMKQADKNNCRWALIIGTTELQKGSVVLKDLTNAEQKEILQSEIISVLKKVQNEKN